MRKIKTLKKNYEFRYVLSKGRFYKGNYITIYYTKNNKLYNEIGIAVNTHIANAVKRNKIKRLIRENYRLIKDNIENGYNLVFLWNKNIDIKNATFINIKSDMINILEKIGIKK
ncbi:MAG: ribonuclease P protein component [Clostridia bacterium]|nr:ribonuclease P protein component [Clostridia bacterium]